MFVIIDPRLPPNYPNGSHMNTEGLYPFVSFTGMQYAELLWPKIDWLSYNCNKPICENIEVAHLQIKLQVVYNKYGNFVSYYQLNRPLPLEDKVLKFMSVERFNDRLRKFIYETSELIAYKRIKLTQKGE
ncbi:MAG TPA: hypothetical protein VEQ18_05565 [Candidatus Nitrosocosmicus sp.]|nr:hypothetical protein [Candidatus Nitrosocosmicus sp.]